MSILKENENTIGKRFALERKRLKLSQQKLADLTDAQRESIGKYERDVNILGGHILSVCYELGFDVKYILTGKCEGLPKSNHENMDKLFNCLREYWEKADEKERVWMEVQLKKFFPECDK